MSIAGVLLFALFIIVPAVVGGTLMSWSRRRGVPYPACGNCAYDLSGSIGAATRCPECGSNFADVGIVPPRGRPKPALLWSGVALVVVALTFSVGMMGTFMAMRSAERAQAQAAAAAALQQQLLQQTLMQVQTAQESERDALNDDDYSPSADEESP